MSKEKKNVLILSTISGFLCKFERGNVRLLQEYGYHVHYAANMNEPHYFFDPTELAELNITSHHVEIARSPWLFRMNLGAYRRIKQVVRDHNIQMIHCHTAVGGVIGRLLRINFWNRIKIIYTTHGFHFHEGAPLQRRIVYQWIEKLLARFTDALITINQEDYNRASGFKLRRGGRYYLIPGVGLNLEEFQPCSQEEREKSRLAEGISKEVFHLSTVGELNANKNHRVVLEALQRMKQEDPNLAEKIRYSIWGDGFLKEDLAEEIRIRELEDVVSMKGYSVDARSSLSGVDAFVFPSKREGLGMVALEALAMGIPVITSNNRGTREYMEDKKNGYMCHENKAYAYIAGINWLRNLDSKERQEIEEQCRKSVHPFCQCKTNQMMHKIYGDISEIEKVWDKGACICEKLLEEYAIPPRMYAS